MLSQKLLLDVGVGMFTGENRNWRCKSAAKSAHTASFRLLAVMSGSGRQLKLFHLNNEAPTGAGGRTDLHEGSIPRKAFSDELAASYITS
jgi:hypothetical protein